MFPRLMVFCFAVGCLVPLVAAAPPDPATEALKLFRQGDLDRACPLFRAVAEKKKTDGAAWNDLALCEAKRGSDQTARVLHLALRFGTPKVRLQAAYNWDRFLPNLSGEYPYVDGCEDLPPSPDFGCDAVSWTCTRQMRGGGSGSMPTFWSWRVDFTVGVGGKQAALDLLEKTEAWFTDNLSEKPAPAGSDDAVLPGPGFVRVRLDETYQAQPKSPNTVLTPDLGKTPACQVIVADPCARRAWIKCKEQGLIEVEMKARSTGKPTEPDVNWVRNRP